MKKDLTKEILEKEYLINKKSTKKIGKEYGRSNTTISALLKKFSIPTRPTGRHTPDIINKRFGKLLVLSREKGKDAKHPIWLCKCDCGEFCTATTVELHNKHYAPKISCVSCSNIRTGLAHWTGYKDISGWFWQSIRSGAKARNLEFTITKEYVWELYEQQNRRCALTGVEINIDFKNKPQHTASLDRIDSSKGYIEGNVQWIYKKLNWLKGNMSEEELISWCRKIVDHHDNKKQKK